MNISDLLLSNGIKPSIQRLQIFNFLFENRIHPSVDEIFISLCSQIPTLSKTTVYNTLKIFEKKGLIQTLKIEDDELRFDIDISDHYHFKCTKCKKIFDIYDNNTNTTPTLPHGFICKKKQINMWGLCKNCSKN
ncbi:MAG: transcriptional repressor [Treponema sp.]|nr:transcriptional repressor [Treponema sp.]